MKSGGMRGIAGKISNETYINLAMLISLVVLFFLARLALPKFASIANIQNLISNQWYIILLGIGVTHLLIAGYFDMSVGGVVAMAGVLSVFFCQGNTSTASELSRGLNLPYGISIALTLLACLGIGAINSFFIAKLKVASIIITLGTMSVARGIAQILTQGAQRNTDLPDVFTVIGKTSIPGTSMTIAVLIVAVFVILAIVAEKKTVFGRRIYQIGANQNAARLSGVKVERQVTILYLISALLAGITGILLASEFGAGYSSRGRGYEFDALVITLLGGTSINGGFGSAFGTVIGALIISVITSTATGLLLRPEWQYIIKGAATFIAIMAQRYALEKRMSNG
ncbi:MAG: ABC transporter permease [Synergistaceae bacterium]|jgi:ribose transport system permease protein|nr:ABC transporter permease [Synergistaceae bacterium]